MKHAVYDDLAEDLLNVLAKQAGYAKMRFDEFHLLILVANDGTEYFTYLYAEKNGICIQHIDFSDDAFWPYAKILDMFLDLSEKNFNIHANVITTSKNLLFMKSGTTLDELLVMRDLNAEQ